MNRRCKSEKNYTDKNIQVCNQWKNYIDFRNWAINNGYKDNLSIDRINNDGNYEPDNCRWADMSTQASNTRKIRSTNTSGYRGVTWNKNANKWSCQVGINNKSIYLGLFVDKIECAKYRDLYIIENNLPHTLNF